MGAQRGGHGPGGARAHERVQPRQPPHRPEALEHEQDEPDRARHRCQPNQRPAVDTEVRRRGDAERGRERQTRQGTTGAGGRGGRREAGQRSQGDERRCNIG